MSHMQQLEFVKLAVSEAYKIDPCISRVLEVGSYDVNGSNRDLIEANEYVGVDLVEGPEVDLVYDGISLALNTQFDLTISSECFEHDPNWQNTFKNMISYTRAGGCIIFTCASKGRLEHGTARTDPSHSPGTSSRKIDHYENLTEHNFNQAFQLSEIFEQTYFHYEKTSCDLFFIGLMRTPMKSKHKIDLKSFDAKIRQAMAKIALEHKGRPRGLLTKFAFIDWPVRVFLASLPSESAFQTYHVFRRRITSALASLLSRGQ